MVGAANAAQLDVAKVVLDQRAALNIQSRVGIQCCLDIGFRTADGRQCRTVGPGEDIVVLTGTGNHTQCAVIRNQLRAGADGDGDHPCQAVFCLDGGTAGEQLRVHRAGNRLLHSIAVRMDIHIARGVQCTPDIDLHSHVAFDLCVLLVRGGNQADAGSVNLLCDIQLVRSFHRNAVGAGIGAPVAGAQNRVLANFDAGNQLILRVSKTLVIGRNNIGRRTLPLGAGQRCLIVGIQTHVPVAGDQGVIGVVIIVNNDLHRLFAVTAYVGLGLSGCAGHQGSRTGLLADCLRMGLAGAIDLHIASGTDDIGSFDLHLRIVARVGFRIQAAQDHSACGESLIGFRFGSGICVSLQTHIPARCLQNSVVDGQRVFNCRVGVSGIDISTHQA